MKLYVLQSVDGSADGGLASYDLTTTCGASWRNLGYAVPLVEGTSNITSLFSDDPLNVDLAADGISVPAVDASGNSCIGTANLTGLPANCTVGTDSISQSFADAIDASGRVIFRFQVDCETN